MFENHCPFPGSAAATRSSDSKTVKYEYESKGGISIPPPYNFRKSHRAAIVMFGYTAFLREGSDYFQGKHTGGVRLLAYYERIIASYYYILRLIEGLSVGSSSAGSVEETPQEEDRHSVHTYPCA